MITQAKIHLRIPCPNCLEGGWRADQLNVGFKTNWHCDKCHIGADIERVSYSDFNIVSNSRKETPVTVTLQSITEPKITLKLHAWKYAHDQNETAEDYASHLQYFYDEHTCPTNWTSQIAEVIFEEDKDPHGVFEFVSVEDGHHDC